MVQVYIEGFGSVEADNVATESTLQRIAGLLGSANNANSAQAQARLAGAANQAAAGLGTIQSATGNTNSSLNGLGAQAGVTSGRIAAFGKSTSAAASSMINSLERSVSSGTDSMSSAFSLMKQAASGGAKVFKDLPILSGLAGAASAAFGILLGILERTTKEFISVQQSGALFGGSMLQFRDAAHNAGLTLTQYNSIMKANAAAMSLFGGGTIDGAKEFGKLSKAITSNATPFLQMGVSFEQMGQRTADYMERQLMLGLAEDRRTMTVDEQSKQVLTLTKQQKMLAAYNGTTLEQERAKQKAALRSVDLQAVVAGKSEKDRDRISKVFTQIQSKFGDGMAKAYLEQQAFGTVATKQSALMLMQNQAQAGIMQELDNFARSNSNAAEQTAFFQKQIGASGDALKRDQLGNANLALIGMAGGANAAIDVARASLIKNTELLAKSTAGIDKKIAKDMEAMAATDGVTKGMIALQQGAQQFQQAISIATTSLMKTDGFKGSVETLGTAAEKAARFLNSLASGREGASAPVSGGTTIPGALNPSGTQGSTPADPKRPMTQPLDEPPIDSVNGKPAVRVVPVGPNSRNIPGAVSFNQTGDPGATPRVQQASFTPEDGSPLQQAVQQNFVDGDGQSQQPNTKLNAELLAALSEIARNTKNTADQSKRSADSANDLARQGLTA